METTTCTQCATTINKLDVFPNNICLICYEANWENNNKNKTQEQIAQELYNDIVGAFGKKG